MATEDQILLGMGDGAQQPQFSPTMRPTPEPVSGSAPVPQQDMGAMYAAAAGGSPAGFGGGDQPGLGGFGGGMPSAPAPQQPQPQSPPPGSLLGPQQFGGMPDNGIPASAYGNQSGPTYTNPGAFKAPGEGDGLFPNLFSGGVPPSGWFTLNDWYGENKVPWKYQAGASLPSTNDWRLLPGQYRDPRYFMINGEIIDRTQIGPDISRGDGQMPPFTGFQSGAAVGYPIAFTNPGWSQGQSFFGFPGSLTGWHSGSPNGG